ncbi:hypothetical protein [Streptomyces sp. NPDC001744]|uniref:hypothetical protein n=1 Tax=Streptomyces sp. NPDC001744 TaxID=3364606 RepID=UPI0036D11110
MTAYGPGEPRRAVHPTGGDAPAPAAGGRETPRTLTVEAAEGIARIEGYLLARRAGTEATEAGAAFARRFPWLGPQERSEVARAFAREHLAVRRRMFEDAVARAEELRHEYGGRYERLRRRLVATVLGVAGTMTVVVSFLVRDVL